MYTPLRFWTAYREAIRRSGFWEQYLSAPAWTTAATAFADEACSAMGLLTSHEYLRLDVSRYTSNSSTHYDWDLRVAFEVENGPYWEDEFCKLCHVVADLKVLVAYQLHKRSRCKDMLLELLPRHRNRMARQAASDWLLIFGPSDRNDSWEAWRLVGGSLDPLHSALPLTAVEMPDFKP